MSWYKNVELAKLINNTQETHYKEVAAFFRPRNHDCIDTLFDASQIDVSVGSKQVEVRADGNYCIIRGEFYKNVPNYKLYKVSFEVRGVIKVEYTYQVSETSGNTIFYHVKTDTTKRDSAPIAATTILPPPTVLAPPVPSANLIAPPPAPQPQVAMPIIAPPPSST